MDSAQLAFQISYYRLESWAKALLAEYCSQPRAEATGLFIRSISLNQSPLN